MLRFSNFAVAMSIAASFFIVQSGWAQPVVASDPAYGAYGLFPVGSTRVLGMGGAFTGLADDSSAVVTNPAGLGFSKHILDYSAGNNRIVNREVFFGPSTEDRRGFPYTSAFQAGSLRMGPLSLGAAYSEAYKLDVREADITGNAINRKRLGSETFSAAASLTFFKRLALGGAFHSEKVEISHQNTNGNIFSDEKKSVYPSFGVLFKMNKQASVGASYTPERRYDFNEDLDDQITDGFTEWFHDVVIPEKLSLGLAFETKKNLTWVGDIDIYRPVKNAIYVGGSESDPNDKILEESKVVLHGGFEFYVAKSKTLDFIWRGGGYREPRRVQNASDRLHFTMGVEVRFYYIVVAASYDQAPGFSNVAQSIGATLGDF